MKKVLFLDRDGTLVMEPPVDLQLDSLDKLELYPKVIRNLYRITQQTDYELVMVTNQDGLGTDSFPEASFKAPHEKMLKLFSNEGIEFDEILIDKSFPHENASTRKPRTGLLTKYINNPDYDLQNSWVIGDRLTDVELAKNLGCKAILMQENSNTGLLEEYISLKSMDWDVITNFLLSQKGRKTQLKRQTKETSIEITLDLDGNGTHDIHTGIGFFDHMLAQLAYHSKADLTIHVEGDLHIDEHHTIEDTALALGEAYLQALGDKRGIERYGFFNLVMDESLAKVALDFSGRPYLVWKCPGFRREKVGNMPVEMFEHFFKSFSDASKCNLHIACEGNNEHHQIEAIFKAFAKSIKMAVKISHTEIQSTKGIL